MPGQLLSRGDELINKLRGSCTDLNSYLNMHSWDCLVSCFLCDLQMYPDLWGLGFSEIQAFGGMDVWNAKYLQPWTFQRSEIPERFSENQAFGSMDFGKTNSGGLFCSEIRAFRMLGFSENQLCRRDGQEILPPEAWISKKTYNPSSVL